MDKRITGLGAVIALVGVAGIWAVLTPGTGATFPAESASERSLPVQGQVVRRGPTLPIAEGQEAAPGPAQVPQLPTPEEWRRQRFERRQSEAFARVDAMVVAGELSEEEAQELRAIADRTFARVQHLMDQREAGEIGPVGAFFRGIPVRITHVSQVVDTLGRDRAREVGQAWRARERADRQAARED